MTEKTIQFICFALFLLLAGCIAIEKKPPPVFDAAELRAEAKRNAETAALFESRNHWHEAKYRYEIAEKLEPGDMWTTEAEAVLFEKYWRG